MYLLVSSRDGSNLAHQPPNQPITSLGLRYLHQVTPGSFVGIRASILEVYKFAEGHCLRTHEVRGRSGNFFSIESFHAKNKSLILPSQKNVVELMSLSEADEEDPVVSPDGLRATYSVGDGAERVVSSYVDGLDGVVRIWDVRKESEAGRFRTTPRSCGKLAFDPISNRFFAAFGNTIHIGDVRSGTSSSMARLTPRPFVPKRRAAAGYSGREWPYKYLGVWGASCRGRVGFSCEHRCAENQVYSDNEHSLNDDGEVSCSSLER